jgi:bifunctional oligoribonuclease and PAP phosphatase NrnA
VYEDLYERTSLGRLRLTGRALDRITTVFGGRVAYMEVQFADYAEVGAIPFDTEDLINYPRSLIGVEVAMLFIEQRDGSIKVSFRSKQADVSRIAEQFGGGGHRLAAGAKVPGPIDMARERVLAAVGDAINNQNDD